ncbi:MAG: chemotaxis protein CheC [Deltaproteobacteria bacterium]|nr:chemotaxis protein CheC [Deltaproteobacteria bacterium]
MSILSNEETDILNELINIGIGRAATNFSEILGREIMLVVPNMHIFNADQLVDYFQAKKMDDYVNVSQSFVGGLAGSGIVSFPLSDFKTLIQTLFVNHDDEVEDFGELGNETLTEIGNVIINAVTCTISDIAGVETRSSLPVLSFSNYIIKLDDIRKEKLYLIGNGNFSVRGALIHGTVIFVILYENIRDLLNHLKNVENS